MEQLREMSQYSCLSFLPDSALMLVYKLQVSRFRRQPKREICRRNFVLLSGAPEISSFLPRLDFCPCPPNLYAEMASAVKVARANICHGIVASEERLRGGEIHK